MNTTINPLITMNTGNTMNGVASYLKRPTATEKGQVGLRLIPSGPAAGAVATDRHVHIGLVLDSSGSMEGERMDSLKRTLDVLIKRLAIGDKISVVSFSNTSVIVLSGITITEENRATTLSEVARLRAEGGTNLESGIAALGGLIGSTGRPDAVVILTDGHINEGISSAGGLCSLLNSYLHLVPVYTLGYGIDHNGTLLRQISTRTQGTYTFIDTEIMLPASIGELMGSLMNEVAKNAALVYPATWTCEEPEPQTAGRYEIGSLIRDKPHWVVFSLPPGSIETEFALTYTVEGSTFTDRIVLVDGGLDPIEIEEQLLRCHAGKALNAVATALQNYNLTEAKRLLAEALAFIAASSASAKPLAIRMKAQLDEMKETVDAAAAASVGHRRVAHDVLSPLLLRTTNLGANYSLQRGPSGGGAHGRGPVSLFATPAVEEEAAAMSAHYSAGPHEGDPDAV